MLDWMATYGIYIGMLVLALAGLRWVYVGGHRGPWGVERREHRRPPHSANWHGR